MSYDFFYTKGWECPKCGAVMAPSTPYCRNCTGITQTTTSSGSGVCYEIDLVRHTTSSAPITKEQGEKENQ